MIRSLFITLMLALPTLAAETGAEIAKVAEIIHRANVAHDAGTVSKWVTADFYSINTQGILLDHDKAIESVKAKSSALTKWSILRTAGRAIRMPLSSPPA